MSPARLPVLAAFAMMLPTLGGCIDFNYLVPAAIGQFGIVNASVPIEEALRSPSVSAEHRRKLQLVLDAREFARLRLGLYTGDQYETFYDSGGEPVAYNLSASPRDRLEPYLWWFPLVGNVPYLAFFTRSEADREARSLELLGYDAYIYELDAYNAGNFLPNPVMSPMLERRDYDIVNIIIHELLHSTVFAPGDTTFNESMASFVGITGAIQFYEHNVPGQVEAARRYFEDQDRFDAFIAELVGDLQRFYDGPGSTEDKIAGREDLFQAARERFVTELQGGFHEPELYDFVDAMPTNNAFLLGFQRYTLDLGVFESVWQANNRSWSRTLGVFRDAAEAPEPFQYLRDWLNTRQSSAAEAPATGGFAARGPVERGPCHCRLKHTLLEAAAAPGE